MLTEPTKPRPSSSPQASPTAAPAQRNEATTSPATDRQADRADFALAPTASWELAVRQLRAIDLFTRNLRIEEQGPVVGHSRELRVDAARKREVLRQQHQAVIDRAHEQLQTAGRPLDGSGPVRVVVAHRNEWFLDRVTSALHSWGLAVVGRLDNGADAIGLTLCEQPDVLLVEDSLALVSGEEVVRQLRDLCPATRLLAQCGYGDRVRPLLEAGADAVYTRQVPPADVAAAIAELVA